MCAAFERRHVAPIPSAPAILRSRPSNAPSSPRADAEALDRWLRRYPQYPREIVEFAAAWAVQDSLPKPPDLAPEDTQRLVDRAMSHAQNVLFAREQASAAGPVAPFASLIGAGRKAGFTPHELAQACDLDPLLLTKLDARQIRPRSIPLSLVTRLAARLRRTSDVSAGYFALPPRVSEGRLFLARETASDGATKLCRSNPHLLAA